MTDKVRPQSETGKVPLRQSARDVEKASLSVGTRQRQPRWRPRPYAPEGRRRGVERTYRTRL